MYTCTHTCLYIFVYVCAKLLQLCPTLCNPMGCSGSDSSVREILQARILEWVASKEIKNKTNQVMSKGRKKFQME